MIEITYGRPAFRHGYSGYTVNGCRCSLCRKKSTDYARKYHGEVRAGMRGPEALALLRARMSRDNARKGEKHKEQRRLPEAAKAVSCTDCGVQYAAHVMQFDHLPYSLKEHTIAWWYRDRPWSEVEVEIAKCEVVCANWHAERTWKRAHSDA